MKLIDTINEDFRVAYKNKEMEKKDFLGVLKTEVTKESKDPDDAFVISKIKTMIKNAEATNSLNELELSILDKYLPKQLTDDEIKTILTNEATAQGYKYMADMGKLMLYMKNTYGGQYDGKSASAIVKTILV